MSTNFRLVLVVLLSTFLHQQVRADEEPEEPDSRALICLGADVPGALLELKDRVRENISALKAKCDEIEALDAEGKSTSDQILGLLKDLAQIETIELPALETKLAQPGISPTRMAGIRNLISAIRALLANKQVVAAFLKNVPAVCEQIAALDERLNESSKLADAGSRFQDFDTASNELLNSPCLSDYRDALAEAWNALYNAQTNDEIVAARKAIVNLINARATEIRNNPNLSEEQRARELACLSQAARAYETLVGLRRALTGVGATVSGGVILGQIDRQLAELLASLGLPPLSLEDYLRLSVNGRAPRMDESSECDVIVISWDRYNAIVAAGTSTGTYVQRGSITIPLPATATKEASARYFVVLVDSRALDPANARYIDWLDSVMRVVGSLTSLDSVVKTGLSEAAAKVLQAAGRNSMLRAALDKDRSLLSEVRGKLSALRSEVDSAVAEAKAKQDKYAADMAECTRRGGMWMPGAELFTGTCKSMSYTAPAGTAGYSTAPTLSYAPLKY